MKYTSIAKQLGSRGGKKRAQKLSPERRKEIAVMGAKARAESIELARRIRINFAYANAVRTLAPRPPRVISTSVCIGKLPTIYDTN